MSLFLDFFGAGFKRLFSLGVNFKVYRVRKVDNYMQVGNSERMKDGKF